MKIFAAITASLVLALVATGAHATGSRAADDAGDVWMVTDSGAGEPQLTDRVTNVDLVGLRVTPTRRALVAARLRAS